MDSLSAVFKRNNKYVTVRTDYNTGKNRIEEIDDVPTDKIAYALVGKTEGYLKIPKDSNADKLVFGPAAGGLAQAGAFEILTYGEKILSIRPIYGYKSKRIEKLMIGRNIGDALVFLERAAGNFSLSYTSALLKAIEGEIDDNVINNRRVLLELERLYNHFNVIHKLASDATQRVGAMHYHAMEEEILRIISKLTGHRYGFGANIPGGTRILDTDISKIRQKLSLLEKEFLVLEDTLEDSKIFLDRLHGTCRIPEETAKEYDIVGAAARASGLKRDVRMFDSFYDNYKPVIEKNGDSLDRMLVRMDEIKNSFDIIKNSTIKPSSHGTDISIRDDMYTGQVEAPHGDVLLVADIENGKVKWVGLRGASRINYIGFCIGITNNIFTDFSFGLDSFGLNFADADLWYGGDL